MGIAYQQRDSVFSSPSSKSLSTSVDSTLQIMKSVASVAELTEFKDDAQED